MEKQLEDMKAKITAKRCEIWDEEPAEMRELKQTNFPNTNSFASVMYAYAEIYHLTKNIYLYRNAMIDGEVSFEAIKKLLSLWLDTTSKRYTTWKLVDSAQLVVDVSKAVQQAQDPQAVKDLLDEFLIYNNKLFVWLDTSIPWFQLGKKITID